MSKLKQTMQHYQAAGAAFWQARSEQERRLLGIGGAVLGLALAYSLLLAPALDGRVKLQQELPLLRQQAAELQALALEAGQLKGQNQVAPAAMTRDALVASLAASSLTAQSISLTGDYAKLQLNGVQFANLMAWLAAQRADSRVAVREASISAQSPAGMVDAVLTLRQGDSK
ncbi:type II secretion system protein GspM [Rugamonas sp. CCM 8940]|uniref:type II secretion system protein GspM n=1 Tax=Rugamonas sp. CCM 8940 TaxID=2765359 RepID=UPI0018F6D23B|nr:type II secretion system protein GspM [Rugamonas sp. CCM 8940]MBJ7310087.1 type II secretion system protein M [Rugamonas sp. CCM 8940]